MSYFSLDFICGGDGEGSDDCGEGVDSDEWRSNDDDGDAVVVLRIFAIFSLPFSSAICFAIL
jgi:hypothetical protein